MKKRQSIHDTLHIDYIKNKNHMITWKTDTEHNTEEGWIKNNKI